MGNPFSSPKMPAPVAVTPPAPVANEADLSADRQRRAKASGSVGNILSSLSSATPDSSAVTKQSKLLGG